MINIRRKYSVPGVMIIIRPAFGAGCVQQSGNAVESQGSINVIDVSVYFSQFGNAGDILIYFKVTLMEPCRPSSM